jgi:hypothetical protein
MIDQDLQYYLYLSVQSLWLIGAGVWLLRRHDELPAMIAAFLFYVFSFRYWALRMGLTGVVDISPFGFDPITLADATPALGYAALSETGLLGAYMYIQNRRLVVRSFEAPKSLMVWLRSRLFLFAVVAILAALVARHFTDAQTAQGKVMAFEISAYLYELPLVLISVALLIALLWRFGGIKGFPQQSGAALIMCVVAYLTFGSSGRFQFLGWVLAVTIIATTGVSLVRRVSLMVVGFGIAMLLFGVAGSLRETDDESSESRGAMERLFMAEDANMLDGFVLLQQVYPAMLPFEYGRGHLEILERPIPRALWPGKPVGGYMNKLGLTTVNTGFTLGISPGLVGSFYQEGGILAVIILSVIYGSALGWVVRYSTRITPMAGILIRAICCASLVPILRGGDLPGVYAWIFMAFWPCFLFLWLRRRYLLAQTTARRPARQPRPESAPLPALRPT